MYLSKVEGPSDFSPWVFSGILMRNEKQKWLFSRLSFDCLKENHVFKGYAFIYLLFQKQTKVLRAQRGKLCVKHKDFIAFMSHSLTRLLAL